MTDWKITDKKKLCRTKHSGSRNVGFQLTA